MKNSGSSDFNADYAREQLRRAGHPLRRIIKALYLRNVLRELDGPSIDLGCGAGQMLERMPSGSVGIEINPYLLEDLRRRGLPVIAAAPDGDPFALSELEPGRYQCLVVSHVLEHFVAADECLKRLLACCDKLGIRTVIVVVPGWAGYCSDLTHKTFIDRDYLHQRGLLTCNGFDAGMPSYFPINIEAAGRWTAYQEMKVVYAHS
jgi:SAM-dependent methyltransferase